MTTFLRTLGLGSLLLAAFPTFLQAQAPPPARNTGEMILALDRLQVLGSVLYIAAHPDDENTAALAYFSKGRKLRTAYLSMTRGGGGQNLIGSELDDGLAAIRTQELLAARRLDGAEQYFTRAIDFGFSKTPEETLAFWGREAVLADVVWVIRSFRPDVIVTRFSPAGGGGHGHHTASAILAVEAFQAAADATRFPEQLKHGVTPWQATRIVWNGFRFPLDATHPQPKDSVALDVGQYDPLLGKAYGEVAAESRSMHRSQGFGVLSQHGPSPQYFEPLGGSPAVQDLFDGIDPTWRRVPGSEPAAALLAQARQGFHPERPGEILPFLLKAKTALEALPPHPWVAEKRRELVDVIRSATGLWVEAIADKAAIAAGDPVQVTASLIHRGPTSLRLEAVTLLTSGDRHAKGEPLQPGQTVKETFSFKVPADTPVTVPLWMRGTRTTGLHGVLPQALIGLPEGPPVLTVRFTLFAEGVPFDLDLPVQYRFRDPVLGERNQPLVVVPKVTATLAQPVQVFGASQSREMGLTLLAGSDGVKGRLRFDVPEGWRAEPPELSFALAKAGDEWKAVTRITPPAAAGIAEMKVLVDVGEGWRPALGLHRITYPHIPVQTLMPPATARLVRVDLNHDGRRIGYVMGAGDDIPACLRILGYDVELLTDEALERSDLSGFNAVVLGIRAYNTRPALVRLKERLMAYVAGGGTEVVLYNVNAGFPGINAGLLTEAIGPYPFKVGRNRVTDETSPVRFLAPGHQALTWPNRITAADFDGWVQERSLYHVEGWDSRYTPLLSMNDPGEKPDEGSLIIANHGKGHFVYTGLAFFRQLPDGVPGAYRLFANLLALGSKPVQAPHE